MAMFPKLLIFVWYTLVPSQFYVTASPNLFAWLQKRSTCFLLFSSPSPLEGGIGEGGEWLLTMFLNPAVEYRNKCIVQKVQTWACLFVCFVWPRTFEHLYLLNWLTTRHPKENFLKVSAQSIKPLKRGVVVTLWWRTYVYTDGQVVFIDLLR